MVYSQVILLFLFLIFTDHREQVSQRIEHEFETSADITIQFGAGILNIDKTEEDLLFEGTFFFAKYLPDIEYYRQKQRGILNLDMKNRYDKDSEEQKYSITSFDEIEDSEWYLKFGKRIPMDFAIEMGAAEADLQFGGIDINSLRLESGASDTRLNFATANGIEMEILEIETGFSHFEALNLLNARFLKMRFEGGVGDYELHFGGDLLKTAYVQIEVSIGSLSLFVPENIAFQLECDRSLFSSIDIEAAEKDDNDIWYSTGFKRNVPYLDFDIDAGVGNVSLRLID